MTEVGGWGDNRTDGGRQYAVLNEWNQVFVDAVRATGGNNQTRYLGVPGYVTNIDLTVENFVLPQDVVDKPADGSRSLLRPDRLYREMPTIFIRNGGIPQTRR